MGGSSPSAPAPTPTPLVESNASSLPSLVPTQTSQDALVTQNSLLLAQMKASAGVQTQGLTAEAELMRELRLREAEAEAELEERRIRMAKGKRDLLYDTATGLNRVKDTKTQDRTLEQVQKRTQDDGKMLLMGGDY